MVRNGYGDVCILGSNRNVSVNTSSPAYTLDVNDNENITGNLTTGGYVGSATYLNSVGSDQVGLANANLSQGTNLSWNNTGGSGETDFINSRGLGSGGFNFIDCSSGTTNSASTLMTVLGYGLGGYIGIDQLDRLDQLDQLDRQDQRDM